ncbi:hypothetical protein GOBAR_AA38630 [Gossypium barbadense]|uniref:Uncharacterized protein n=1 Tax=Gossypium barbadense TaxID=3634 RepID=A0A2P5VTB5_GOSBA|nr:hypothetical protein GOBAR_AA38630 [Gossypium barbadense]
MWIKGLIVLLRNQLFRGAGVLECSGIVVASGKTRNNKIVVLLGEAVKCRTLNGDSLVAKSITSLRFDLSSMEHVESCVNQQGPPYKAKYS